jgi:prolipoprotein diacylglyceryltransferase
LPPELRTYDPQDIKLQPSVIAKEHDGGASITGGILGILLGAAFLIAACLHWKRGDQTQGRFQVEEVPAAEIVSEMQQAAGAICSF